MGGSKANRPREKVVELPEVPAEFGQLGTPQYEPLNKFQSSTGSDSRDDLFATSIRLRELKAHYHRHVKRFSPWQLLGDRVQEAWHPASPLSQHAAIVPPPYGELLKIENQLADLFSDPERFSERRTHTQQALDEWEGKFQSYQADSKHGRDIVQTVAKVGAMLPAAPFIVGGWPLVGAGAAAVTTAVTQSAIENEQAALEGDYLSWPQLVAEAAKSGGSAFLEVFVVTKFTPYLMARLPGEIGARISDEQLALLGRRLGRTLSRTQLVESLSRFSAELWANVLSSGAATCFELTFDLLRSKGEMTLAEFASSLVQNMVAAGGLQILVGALTHAITRLVSTRAKAQDKSSTNDLDEPAQTQVAPHVDQPQDRHPRLDEPAPPVQNHINPRSPSPLDDFEEPLRSQVAQLLELQRIHHPHLAKPIPWHGTEPLEITPSKSSGQSVYAAERGLSPGEVERIMARIKAYAHENLPPKEADLIVRDLENWRQNPVTDPRKRRQKVDASNFLSDVYLISRLVMQALKNGHFAELETKRKGAVRRAQKVLKKAETYKGAGKVSATQLEGLWAAYVDALHPGQPKEGWNRVLVADEFPILQTGPTLSYPGHFGEVPNNTVGVLNIAQRGHVAPGGSLDEFPDWAFPLHDGIHVQGLGTEFAPSFPSYLAATDRRLDFAEALRDFKNLFNPREQWLIEIARFAARWENQWAPTAEHLWAATREPSYGSAASNHVVQTCMRILKKHERTDVTLDEVEAVVGRLRTFAAAYLDSVPDGALRKRNALFQEKINNSGIFTGRERLLAHTMARTGAPVPTGTENIVSFLAKPTLSPEEFLVFFKDYDGDPILQFIKDFITEHPLPSSGQSTAAK